jgi:endo-1,4-beta-xylanase
MANVRLSKVLPVVLSVASAATALVCWGLSQTAASAGTDPVALRTLAAARAIHIGTAVNATVLAQEPAYGSELGTDFDSVTPEDAMKWAVVEPVQGQFNWAPADSIVDFATRHGQAVRGHTLVWYHSLPDWLTQGSFTTDQLRTLLQQHITAEVSRYAGRVGAWDVVNEAVNADGSLRHSIWLDRLGPGYIADAFRWAHAADPAAKLYLNDYGAESANPKSNAVYALVRDLRAQGVPVDGVGFQTHALFSDQLAGLTGTLRRFADLGVEVALTELDARMPLPADATRLATQAQVYRRAVNACLAVPRCVSVTVWGFTDAHSWIPAAYSGYGAADLLDETLRAKPAYDTVHTALATTQRSASDPVGWWRLDDPPGAPAVDSSGYGRDVTVAGGQLGTPGRAPGMTAFAGNGTDSGTSTAAPVLRTDTSFTVSAWVDLTDKSASRVVASQDGDAYSAFYLMYQPATDRWEFTAPSAPAQPLTWLTARSATPPATGVWTHLTGVYDAVAHELRLYVDGALAGVRTGVTTWNAGGPFHIGRSLSGGRFAGSISDVRAWNRALPASEITMLAETGTGCWPLDGDSGDRCGFDRDGTATPSGVSWTTDRAGTAGTALALDGIGAVDVAGPVVFTDRSYTVSAWVRLADKTGYHVVASQDGTVRDAFYLEYHPGYDRWALMAPSTDATTVTWYTALSTTVPAVGVWTHLTGVYDAGTGQLRLYVNGVRQATASVPVSWRSNGPFHIGRAMSGSRFTGDIDDVHVYASALSDGAASVAG